MVSSFFANITYPIMKEVTDMAHEYGSKFDEVVILWKELEEKKIRYIRKDTSFWVYSDKYPDRILALIYRSDYETWLVIESRNGKIYRSYNQFISIILSMVNKFNNGEPY